jgi:hypothetical protein
MDGENHKLQQDAGRDRQGTSKLKPAIDQAVSGLNRSTTCWMPDLVGARRAALYF